VNQVNKTRDLFADAWTGARRCGRAKGGNLPPGWLMVTRDCGRKFLGCIIAESGQCLDVLKKNGAST